MSLPKYFGLDIGSSAIKIAYIKDQISKRPGLLKAGSIETPLSTYGNPDATSKKKLAESIKELVDQLKLDTKNVVTAVSERDVFSSTISFSYDNDKSIDESAFWAISKIIPVPIETVNYSYLPISVKEEDGRKVMEALVISVEKNVAEHYAEIVDMAGLIPIALETEGVALVRSVSRFLNTTQDSMLIDVGSNSTSICIVRGKNLVYTTSIQTGSDVITRSIAQAFSLDLVQAEEYKKTYGIEEKYFEGKIAHVITPVLDTILMDVNRALQFFRQEQPESNVTSIKIIGESSAMPGIIPYITKYLGIAAEISDPLTDMDISKISVENKQAYAVAIGLAMKTDFS